MRADFSLKGFPGSTRLLELAHTIEEMKNYLHLRPQGHLQLPQGQRSLRL